MVRLLFGGSIFSFIYFNAQADTCDVSNALTQSDYATAAAEFTKLAKKDDASVQVNLGYMYYVGGGFKQELTKAAIYITKFWVVFSQIKQAYFVIFRNKNNLKRSK